MRRRAFCAVLMLLMAGAVSAMDLSGEWRFRMDPDNVGLAKGWPTDGISGDVVSLPGSMDENGKGKANTERHVEYLSRLHEYVGAAWYERDVVIPPEWADKRITLFLERVHWESRVWVDGKYLGTQDSLCAPHVHDLTLSLNPGKHRISICVDNRVKYYVGMNAHSVTEHTQTNWNGIIGRIELCATDPVYIADVQVYPDVARCAARVKMRVANTTGAEMRGKLSVAQKGQSASAMEAAIAVSPDATGEAETLLTLDPNTPLWGDGAWSPSMLEVRLAAKVDGRDMSDTRETVLALREIGRNGSQLTLNGRPYFVRGNLECCIFPITAHPPMDFESWRKLLSTQEEYGVNHIRVHSWCPPEAAFAAADLLGMTLHVETPVWTEVGTHADTDDFIRAESERILDTYGNHPSFCFLATGNEPSGKHMNEFFADIIARWKAKDPRCLYTTCAGWPELDMSDFHSIPERKRIPLRLHNNAMFGPSTDFDYAKALEGCNAPVIAHELAQWCVYPRYDEIDRYTGVLRAWNFETFRDSLAKNGMAGRDVEFSRASGRLQWLMYKADMEAVLRTPGMAGYQLLSVQDFPGQGSALVGVANALWDNKQAVTPEEFRRVNNETVPLLRFQKCVWRTDEVFRATSQIAHFGVAALADAKVEWSVGDDNGKIHANGAWTLASVPLGNNTMSGEMEVALSNLPAPARYEVTMRCMASNAGPVANSWSIWVYPESTPEGCGEDILIATRFDRKTERALAKGRSVLLLPDQIAPEYKVPSAFEPVFWDMQWFPGQRRQLGVLCDPAHPALAAFPNSGHTDWQWWELLNKSRVMNLSALPPGLEPIVRVMDDWNTNRPLGAVFEMRAGAGKLMVCTLDIANDLRKRPAATALRRSLLDYMAGDRFDPKAEATLETLRRTFGDGK